ncbi:transporter substrate-binding domain-containing protein [Shewanella sp. VB17]|uniref:substrate-binding periplasmic protein n=1 Tax=Shewanella sp. VB17 TaxID=2739432 RepID=UPI001567426C|nr:transporter substrate-binding domain-containing protein [Shewanella sp. VB17]NRD74350.1 transporter substrate-binding domain-containing protein [Shewanella sp. VB17]
MNKVILLSGLIFFSSSISAQTKVTIYGDDDYPPYSYAENGEMTGIYTMILQSVAKKMPDYNIVIKNTPWKRGLAEIEKGKMFALYPPYNRPTERPYMEYETAILDEELSLFCSDKITQEKRAKWPEDYYGLSIGNNAGFSPGGEAFLSAVKAGKITLKEVKGTSKNLQKLISGRIDCYLNDGLSIEWELKQLQKSGKYSGTGVSKALVISAEQGYLGFVTDGSKFAFKDDFKQQYNAVLSQMKDSGEVKKIVEEFLK